MKVLKFGGTSVGSLKNILNVKSIIENEKEPVIVVVSALSGITDKLLNTSKLAAKGDIAYKNEMSEISNRHLDLIDNVIVDSKKKAYARKKSLELLDDLNNIYRGVFLINDLSDKTLSTILSYGERLSSLIISYVIKNAHLYDSRQFIKTIKVFQKHLVDFEATKLLVNKTFENYLIKSEKHEKEIAIVPGFISTDKDTGEITTLGRGGSDYTASILASELKAKELQIWTDVDGFMTADPKVISSAYVIKHLSYLEATELCNFGAKVIYPPTIYPVFRENIPIRVLNTFKPDAPGTLITQESIHHSGKAIIKGISSISDTCLITVQGLGMVGVIGINERIFSTLANNGISVFMVSQASSENNTTFAVKNADADLAVKVLNKEFAIERSQGEMNDVTAEHDLATVAIVGENMKSTPGIAGKLFGTLGRSGISVIACAQGASETNISFVIKKISLKKALNSIHDSFFLSDNKELNLFIAGIGTVGGKLIDQIRFQQKKLLKNNLKINVIGVANSHKAIFNRDGVELKTCIETLKSDNSSLYEESNPEKLLKKIEELNMFNSVFVDCTSSPEIAQIYERLLLNNVSIVAANKIAASSEYSNYQNLKNIARNRGIKYLFETNVGAGLPIINTMNGLINSGDHILKLEAVLSGTLNYIFNELSADISFSETIVKAMEAGYAEPDPRIDLSGKDVVRKLVILAREAGYVVEQEDVKKKLFVNQEYFSGSLEEFWEGVKKLDKDFEKKRQKLESENKRFRFVATMDHGKCEVGLKTVDSSHPFYDLEGSNNIIMISTERYKDYPMIIKGYGAGADVTAAGVFADIISIANIR